MKKIYTILFITLLIMGCGKGKAPAQKSETTERVKSVKISNIKEGNLTEKIPFTAKLEGITDVTLTSETSGKVIKIFKQLGEYVKRGEEIGRVDDKELRLQLKQRQAELLSAEGGYQSAKLEFESSEQLFKRNSISELEYIAAKTQYIKAEAAVQSSKVMVEKSEKSLNNGSFVAPVSGYITNINLEVGEFISNGKEVCTIVDHSILKIKTGLAEDDISYAEKGKNVVITKGGVNYSGIVVGRGIKPNSNNIYPIEIVVENPDLALLPGMSVKGNLLAKTYSDVTYTKESDLVERFGKYFIYKVEGGTVKEIELNDIQKVDGYIIIKDKLEKDLQIVTSGGGNLRDGTKIKVVKR